MDNKGLDNLFLLTCQGDKKANDDLCKWFVGQGLHSAKSYAKQKGIYAVNYDEVVYKLQQLYLLVIRSFSIGSIPFKRYAELLTRKRIIGIVVGASIKENESILSLDSVDPSGGSMIETIASKDYEEMKNKINANQVKQVMASKRVRNYKLDLRLKRVMKLMELGYKRSKIMELTGLTLGRYKYVQKLIKDMESGLVKIDLK